MFYMFSNEELNTTNRQWCFRRPSQNSVWQLEHLDTAWSGTHKTDVALFVELAPDDGGPLRSSTASHEEIETFSTPLSTIEFYKMDCNQKEPKRQWIFCYLNLIFF